MNKIILSLGSSLFALCALATVDVSSVTKTLPSATSTTDGSVTTFTYSITESVQGVVEAGSATKKYFYEFENDGVMLVQTSPNGARHVTKNATFDTNGHSNVALVAAKNVSTFGKGYNYFGLDGAVFTGGGSISVETSAEATPVWVNSFTADGTILNFNLGDKLLQANRNQTTKSYVYLKNSAVVNWNSVNPTTFYQIPNVSSSLMASTPGQYIANTSTIKFEYVLASETDKSRGTINFSDKALTTLDGVGNVLFNYSFNSDHLDTYFDSSLGNNIVMYNNTGSALDNKGIIHLEAGKTLMYKSAGDYASVNSVKASGKGKILLDFDGTMSGYASVGTLLQGVNNDSITYEVVANRNIVMDQRISANTCTLILKANSDVSTKGVRSSYSNTAGNNNMGFLSMENGSTLTVAGGLRFSGGDINGTISVNGIGRSSGKAGVRDSDDFIVGLYGGNIKFGANGSLTQTFQTATGNDLPDNWTRFEANWDKKNDETKLSSYDVVKTSIETESASGSIKFGNKLLINRGTSFTLNSSNAFVLGSGEAWNATTQATSVFNISDYKIATDSNLDIASRYLANRFVINAANEIGAFSFDSQYRVIEIAFGSEGSLILGAEEGEFFNSLRGDYLTDGCVVLDSYADEQFKVFDLTKEEIEHYFTVSDASKYALDIQEVEGVSNAYWVNVVVPEPAEWAMIFGAIALGFVAYRRRK